jgi:hypothetical protein
MQVWRENQRLYDGVEKSVALQRTVPKSSKNIKNVGKRHNQKRRFTLKTSKKSLLPFTNYRLKSTLKFTDIPSSFDWRTKVGNDSLPLLAPVRDQEQCGGCYAFATAQSLSHRFAIATKGEKRPILSPQDLINCGSSFVQNTLQNPQFSETLRQMVAEGKLGDASDYALDGCDGGLLVSAADYTVLQGLPEEIAVPYQEKVGACRDHSKLKLFYGKQTHQLTKGIEVGIPGEDATLDSDTLKQNEQNMQLAIMNDGPIVCGLNVYSDLMYYPTLGEVYVRQDQIIVDGQVEDVVYEGGHAVVIVGWGEDNSTGITIPYWIIQNSWGKTWGKNGYFYIKRGSNLCNVEYDACAVLPNLDNAPTPSVVITNDDQDNSGTKNEVVLKSEQNNIGGLTDFTLGIILLSLAVGAIIIVISLFVAYTSYRKKRADKKPPKYY